MDRPTPRPEAETDPHGTRYRVVGPAGAPALVLVHGVGLDASMWAAQVPVLAARRRVVTYDLLGHGGSVDPPGARTLDDYAVQLARLADHLGLARFALAGFSMGALVALAFAAREADRLDRLALLSGVFRRDAAASAAVRARCEAVAARGPLANVEAAIERWFTPAYLADHPQAAQRVRATFAAHRGDGYLKAYRVFAEADASISPAALAALRCPVLVATGADDAGSTPAMARALAAAIPGARCLVVPGARHMLPVENAAALDDLLESFLETCDTAAREELSP